MRIAKDMSLRKILKLQKELEAFDLRKQEMDWEMQQQAVNLERQEKELDLLTLWFEERRKSNQPFASPEIDQSHQGNEVAIDLPPKFDEHEDEREEIKEEEKEDEVQEKDGNTFEEIKLEAKEGEILTLDTHHPPKDKEDHSLLFISFGEPLNLSPTPSPPQTLK